MSQKALLPRSVVFKQKPIALTSLQTWGIQLCGSSENSLLEVVILPPGWAIRTEIEDYLTKQLLDKKGRVRARFNDWEKDKEARIFLDLQPLVTIDTVTENGSVFGVAYVNGEAILHTPVGLPVVGINPEPQIVSATAMIRSMLTTVMPLWENPLMYWDAPVLVSSIRDDLRFI